MVKLLCLTSVVILLALLSAPSVQAAPNRLFLDLGAGWAGTSLHQDTTGLPPENYRELARDEQGMLFDFRAGVNINKRLAMYMTHRWTNITTDELDNPVPHDVTFSLTALGASYRFRSEAPTFYLTAGAGKATWNDEDGIGGFYGAGYQVTTNMAVEITEMSGDMGALYFAFGGTNGTFTTTALTLVYRLQ